MRNATAYIMTLMLIVTATACGSDNEPVPAVEDFLLNIVTYKGYDSGTARFEYIDRNGAITYLVATGFEEPLLIARDKRVLMRYRETRRGADATAISIYNITTIISDSLRVNSQAIEEYARHPIALQSLWQTGEYINLRCRVDHTGKERKFYLMMDGDTKDDETVVCYLIHDLLDHEAYHLRDCYASFNVGYLMKRPGCKRFVIRVVDTVRPDITEYIFEK